MVRESRRFSTLFSRKIPTTSIPPTGTPILDLPIELFLLITSHLSLSDLRSFILTNRCVSNLLQTSLYDRLITSPDSRYAALITRRAASMGHENVVRFMLDKGISLTDPVPWIGMEYPLHLAAREGRAGVVELMMEHETGGEKAVSLVDDHGNTPFHLAALKGHRSVVRILLEKGVDPNLPSEIGLTLHGATALHYAAAWGHESVVKLLLRRGADPNARTKDWAKNTPLQWVLENFCCLVMRRPLNFEPIIRILLANGADISLPDSHGRTVLHFATTNGDYSIQRRFGEHESRIKFGSVDFTPLRDPKQKIDLAKSLHKAVVSLLLESGADIDARDKDGKTPLHYAAEHREEYVVRNLLELGADPNAKTLCGETPLQSVVNYAWSPETNDTVLALLENGADLNVKDIFGRTAMEAAEYGEKSDKGQKQLARLMQQFAAGTYPEPKPKPKSFVSRLLHIRGGLKSGSSSLMRRRKPIGGDGLETKATKVGDATVPKSSIPLKTEKKSATVCGDIEVVKRSAPSKVTTEAKEAVPTTVTKVPVGPTATFGATGSVIAAATEDATKTENVAITQTLTPEGPTKSAVTSPEALKGPVITQSALATEVATANSTPDRSAADTDNMVDAGDSGVAESAMIAEKPTVTNDTLAPKDYKVTRSPASTKDTVSSTAPSIGGFTGAATIEDPVEDVAR